MAIKDPENNIQVSLNYNTVLQWLPVNWSNWDFALNHWHLTYSHRWRKRNDRMLSLSCVLRWQGDKKKKRKRNALHSTVKAWQWLIMRQCVLYHVQGNCVHVNIQSTWQKQLYVRFPAGKAISYSHLSTKSLPLPRPPPRSLWKPTNVQSWSVTYGAALVWLSAFPAWL